MPSVPYLAYVCNRRAWRLRTGNADEAFIQFDLADGSRWSLSLLEISEGGVGFGLDNGRPSLTIGATIEAATLHVGDFEISGSARVSHVTSEFAVGTLCGAEFRPADDADRRLMALLLHELELRKSQSE